MSGPGQVYNGRYEIRRKIARGGMADVYLAHDAMLDRPVALKVLFPEFATDPAFVQRFRREAQSAANLSHSNIVSVFDWGEQGGTYFIVMEFIDGRSLSQLIRDDGPLEPLYAAAIAADIAAALDSAHRNGVVHRDVKPGNVLISSSGQVKVTDFGIARAVSSQENLTQTGTVMGTATYFSPEQARGEAVDPRSDVYSLGVVLYEMLAGQPPFSGDSPVSVAYKHVQETPEPLSHRNRAVPPALEAITHRAMAKDKAARYASADDLRADLRRFRQGQPVEAAPPGDATSVFAGAPTAGMAATTALDRTRAASAYQEYDTGTGVLPGRYPEEPPAEPKRRPWFGVVVALLVVALVVGLFLLARMLGVGGDGAEQVEVPDVVDLPQAQAVDLLTREGLDPVVESEANSEVEAGTVFRQDPEAGRLVDEDTTVTVVVSAGPAPVSVPDVTGQQVADAVSAIEGADLVADPVEQPDDSVPAGEVLSQSPEANAEVAPGTRITLRVSSGPADVAVPDVADLSLNEASNRLGREGLQTTTVEEPSNEVDEGNVIGTDPPAGTRVPEGSRVTIVVSSGPPPTTTTSSTTSTTRPGQTSSTTTSSTTSSTVPDDGEGGVGAGPGDGAGEGGIPGQRGGT